jgi:Zinc carboxypeptidase
MDGTTKACGLLLRAGAGALILVLATPFLLAQAATPGLPERLWAAWPTSRVIEEPAPCLDPAALAAAIQALAAAHTGLLEVEEVGRSIQGRPISLLSLGRGPRQVLLWSQMHGDEPSATPALLDLTRYLLEASDPAAAAILERFTLRMVPMLNPDGAQRYVRRNAQAIDINRDALRLVTPEGRLLKDLRDRFDPELGFNLHDQDRRTTVGDTGHLATIALLAVAGDAEGTMTPGRARAKRVCASVVRTLSLFVAGGISRYDEDWNPRAFGDNLTAWGTPVVLIESGGIPPGLSYDDLTRLDFVAILGALSGLARNDLADVDPALYESLERNADHHWVDVLVSGAEVWQPEAGEPYRADVGFDLEDADPVVASCPSATAAGPSAIREVGDGHLLAAARRVEASGRLLTPGLAVSIRGLAARDWLDVGALARLGVARVRWHVADEDYADALTTARRLEGAGRPVIELATLEEPAHLLQMDGPLEAPVSLRMDAVLAALGGRGFWERNRGRTLQELLGPLAGADDEDTAPVIAPDREASFLLWQPGLPGAREPAALVLERVFVDGREPGPD